MLYFKTPENYNTVKNLVGVSAGTEEFLGGILAGTEEFLEVFRPVRKSFLWYHGRDGTVQKWTFLTYWKIYFANVLLAHNNRDRGGHVGVDE